MRVKKLLAEQDPYNRQASRAIGKVKSSATLRKQLTNNALKS